VEDLFKHYNHELAALRHLAATFAKAHPNNAAHLKIGPNSIEDPMVAHLLEAVAFLNARVQQKINDDMPEISNTLLDIIYPHYLQPIPSISILQLIGQDSLQGPHIIPAKTDIVTTTLKGDSARFKTCYPVTLLPLKINAITYQSLTSTSSSLKIIINITNSELKLPHLKFKELRFYINTELQLAYIIYELLFNQTSFIELRNPATSDTIKVSNKMLKPVGFADNEYLTPNPPHSFPGYRLLSEFFAFPEKFLFFDMVNWPDDFVNNLSNQLEIVFHFRKENPTVQQQITDDSFALGCTPIINLFEQDAVPIHLDNKQQSYHLKADINSDLNSIELHSITDINVSDNNNQSYPCYPLYGLKYYHQQSNDEALFWHISRKSTWEVSQTNIPGQELFLNISNPNGELYNQKNLVIHSKIRCCNRNLAEQIPYSNDTNDFQFWHHADEYVAGMQRLTRVTSPLRPKDKEKLAWCLITHLSENYLNFDNNTGLKKLQDILKLYNFNDDYGLLTGLTHLSTQSKTIRHPKDLRNGFCKSTEITLTIDENKTNVSQWYLLASVLAKFFNMSTSINSFAQLILASKQHGVLAQWQPETGTQILN